MTHRSRPARNQALQSRWYKRPPPRRVSPRPPPREGQSGPRAASRARVPPRPGSPRSRRFGPPRRRDTVDTAAADARAPRTRRRSYPPRPVTSSDDHPGPVPRWPATAAGQSRRRRIAARTGAGCAPLERHSAWRQPSASLKACAAVRVIAPTCPAAVPGRLVARRDRAAVRHPSPPRRHSADIAVPHRDLPA